MCGIFGAIATKQPFGPRDFERFSALTDLVSYRGPDDSGRVALGSRNQAVDDREHFDVFLGHRRLSIVDLSAAGHQPMLTEDGCWITFNGEIFNHVELREELKAKGHHFKTATDTEVILHIYQEYGEQGFDKLNGMWAFAIADLPRHRMVLSRDRFSIKPLYFLQVAEGIFFGSEIKQLLPLLHKRELNTEIMLSFLAQGLLDHSPETFFRGIQRVPARSNLVISLDAYDMKEQRYWEFGRAHVDQKNSPVDTFRDLLADSVRLRLRSDVKVGVLLSGGLDSSAIAVVADQMGDGKLEMYSVVSKEPEYSEERFIDALTATRGLKTRKLTFQCDHVSDAIAEVVYHSDEPFVSFSVLAQYKLFEVIKRTSDVTVLLSGQGGDEILLGYIKFFVFYLQQLVRQRAYVTAIVQFLASALRGTMIRQLAVGESRRFLPFLNRFRRVIGKNYNFVPLSSCTDLRERQIIDIEKYSVPALTHYEDRNSMAHSLEIRHPFLDHRIVDFLLDLPPDWKIKNGWTKYLLRQSCPELPDQIRWRKDKQGFTTAEESWLKVELCPLIRNSFQKSTLGEMGVVNDREFLKYYEGFRGGRRISYTDISRTLIAEVWAHKFLK